MLFADLIAQMRNYLPGSPKVTKLFITIQINRAENDVVVEARLSRTFFTFSRIGTEHEKALHSM